MTEPLQPHLKRLKALNERIRYAAEQAETRVGWINDLLNQAAAAGWMKQAVILGPVIHVGDYAPTPGGADSGWLLQAALVMPGGLGAVGWDTEEHFLLSETYEALEADAPLRFQPFHQCDPLIKALIAPHAESLLAALWRRNRGQDQDLCRDAE